VALGVDMKSILGIAKSTIKPQVKYVRYISLAVGTLIHLTVGRSIYFLYVRWMLLFSTLVLFSQIHIFLFNWKSKKEYFFIQIAFIIISLLVFKAFTRISKKYFLCIGIIFCINCFLIYNVSNP
jgi:hypothetical protein